VSGPQGFTRGILRLICEARFVLLRNCRLTAIGCCRFCVKASARLRTGQTIPITRHFGW
jgi:hypothetical protein